jgi:isoquinoline 1-oxidoreductase subunit beta
MKYEHLMHSVAQSLARQAVAAGSAQSDAAPSRRVFLKLSVASGFAMGLVPMAGPVSAQGVEAPRLKPTDMPLAFIAIDRAGIVTVQSNRLDMGQGSETGLAMLLADELDADWTKIRAVPAPLGAAYVDPAFGMHLTGGSFTLKNSYMQYRELGARTRAMLVAAAAAQWGVAREQVTVRNGVVSASGRQAGFGELAEAAMRQPVPEKVVLKDPRQFGLVGRPTTRLDASDIARGQKKYGSDLDLPGMKTVLLARPPVFGGKVARFDASKALVIKGVTDVLRIDGLDRGAEAVAVVADGFWPASQGRQALQVEWNLAGLERTDTVQQLARFRELAQQPGIKATQADASRLKDAYRTINAEYAFPYLAHGAMEPLNCAIEFDGRACTLWYAAQMHDVDAAAVAKALGIDTAAVKINSMPAGGGFGRRTTPSADYVVEAAMVAKAYFAAGKRGPLKIQWTRDDDMKGGYYRPMTVHRVEIGLDDAGNVIAWRHRIVSQSILTGSALEQFMVKDGVDMTTVEGIQDTPYAVPIALEVHNAKSSVPVLWWRSVGHTHTAYVMETLVDEVARATGKDPLTLRRRWLGNKHPRHSAALDLVVEKSGYGTRQLPAGRAFGLAIHESFSSIVAYVAEVSIQDGTPVVHRVTAAVHCNLCVNPRAVETQVQGAVLMGFGTLLPGAEITLKDGQVEQGFFTQYTVARMRHMPVVDVHIVPSGEPPTGMGEPGLPPLAPAVANAVARLTGHTPRELPFKLA